MPQLVFYLEGDFPRVYNLDSEKITIGRKSANAIQIDESFISGFHAELVRESDGNYRLTDLKSHNGTTVNGNRLGDALLEDGDQVTFGLIKALYSTNAVLSSDAPAPASGTETPSQLTAPINLHSLPLSRTSPLTDPDRDMAALNSRRGELEIGLREQQGCLEALLVETQELDARNDEKRDALAELERNLEQIRKENDDSKSQMAMREHLVRDLTAQEEAKRTQLEESTARHQSLTEENKSIETAVETARTTLEELKSKAAKRENRLHEAAKQLRKLEEYQSRRKDAEEEVAKLRREREQLDQEVSELRSGKSYLKDELNRLREELNHQRRGLHEVRIGLEERDKAAKEAEEEIRKLNEFRSETAKLETRTREFTDRLKNLESDLALKQRNMSELESSLEARRRELDELQGTHLVELNQTAQTLEKQNTEQQRRFEILKSQIAQTEEKCADLGFQLAAKEDRLRSLGRELERENRQLDVSRSETEKLRKDKEMIQQSLKTARNEYDDLCLKLDESKKTVREAGEARVKLEEFEARNSRIQTQVTARENRLKDLESNVKDTRQQLDKLQGTVTARKNHIAELESGRLRELNEKTRKLEDDAGQKQGILEAIRKQIEKIEHQRNDAESRLEKRRGELHDLECNRDTQRKELEDRRAENKKLEDERNGLRGELDAARSQLEETRRRIEDGKKAANASNEELARLKDFESKAGKLETDLKKKEARLSELAEQAEARSKSLDKLEESIARKETDLKKVEKLSAKNGDLATLENQVRELRKELETSRDKLENAEEQCRKLNEKSDELSQLVIEKTAAVQRLSEEFEKREQDYTQLARKIEAKNSQIQTMDQRLQAAGVRLLNTTKDMLTSRSGAPPSPFSRPATLEAVLATGRGPADRPGIGESPMVPIPAPIPATSTEIPTLEDADTPVACPPLRILHPRMQSPVHYFPDGAGNLDPDRFPPIGIYALAGCTNGSVHKSVDTLPSGEYPILLLLSGSLEKDRELIREVSAEAPEKTLLACWREGRLDRLASELTAGSAFQQFTDLLADVSGILSIDSRTGGLFKELHVARHSAYVPLPCPVDSPAWDYSVTTEARNRGIFVSADGFDESSETHRAKLDFLRKFATDHQARVTVYHHLPDALPGLDLPAELLTEPNRTLTYGEYLVLLSEHRFVIGFGKDLLGGDVLGDALLARSIYLGGDSDLASLLYPDTCLASNSPEALHRTVENLLTSDDAYEAAVAGSQERAHKHVSFQAARRRISKFLQAISPNVVLAR